MPQALRLSLCVWPAVRAPMCCSCAHFVCNQNGRPQNNSTNDNHRRPLARPHWTERPPTGERIWQNPADYYLVKKCPPPKERKGNEREQLGPSGRRCTMGQWSFCFDPYCLAGGKNKGKSGLPLELAVGRTEWWWWQCAMCVCKVWRRAARPTRSANSDKQMETSGARRSSVRGQPAGQLAS